MLDPLQVVVADIIARLEAGERNIKPPKSWRKYRRASGDVEYGGRK